MITPFLIELGAKLKYHRMVNLKLTQKEYAKLLKIDRTTYILMEKGIILKTTQINKILEELKLKVIFKMI